MNYYPPRFLFRRQEILRRIKGGSEFLEVGPGNLHLAVDLLQHFANGTLIDFNPSIGQLYGDLPKGDRERLELIIADFMSIKPKPKYDCVIACEVLEHIQDQTRFLNQVYAFLNDDGQIVLSVPAKTRMWSKHDEIVGHLRRYEKQDITNLLTKHGYRDVEIVSYGFPFINILRWLRILLAYFQYDERRRWSQRKQTEQSGIVNATRRIDSLGVLCNKHTVYPFGLLSRLFGQWDLSNGYVVTAHKGSEGSKCK